MVGVRVRVEDTDNLEALALGEVRVLLGMAGRVNQDALAVAHDGVGEVAARHANNLVQRDILDLLNTAHAVVVAPRDHAAFEAERVVATRTQHIRHILR